MQSSPQNKPLHTWKPTTAGILSIVGGGVSVLTGLGALRRGEFIGRVLWHWRWETIGSVALVLGIVAIVGGIFALMRSTWGMALAGAICALFPPHTGVLGVLAIVFVSLSKDEFDQAAPKQQAQPPAVPPTPPANKGSSG